MNFDIALLWSIILSIFAVMLESIDGIREKYGEVLRIAEWIFTIVFTIEYLARIISIRKPWYYLTSFYGIIDFLSTIPVYLSFFIVGLRRLLKVHALRILRVCRILKVARYVRESNKLVTALKNSRVKIFVFL